MIFYRIQWPLTRPNQSELDIVRREWPAPPSSSHSNSPWRLSLLFFHTLASLQQQPFSSASDPTPHSPSLPSLWHAISYPSLDPPAMLLESILGFPKRSSLVWGSLFHFPPILLHPPHHSPGWSNLLGMEMRRCGGRRTVWWRWLGLQWILEEILLLCRDCSIPLCYR